MESSTCTDMKTDSIPDGTSDEECSDPDPRIQTELDKLNTASTEINRLENELDEARTKYRSIVSGTSGEMELIAHGRKKSIHKAREYYRLTIEAKLAQSEALKAARMYQTAVGVYKAAKETVALAESRLTEDANTAAAQLTSAWQEMLNHAISKVSVAEQEKAKCEQNHKRRSSKYAELQAQIKVLEKKFGRSIKKARPYFELKAELDVKLMQQKQNVSDIQTALRCFKMKYNDSLRKLETISEEIHQTRRERFWSKIPRMPGVGADTDSDTTGLSEVDLKSIVSSEWSEYGDEEFDTESITDDEVFDIHCETGRKKGVDRETDLVNKIDTLDIAEPLSNNNSPSKTLKAEGKIDISDARRVLKTNKVSQCKDKILGNVILDENDKGSGHTFSASDSEMNTGISSENDSQAVKPEEQVVGKDTPTCDETGRDDNLRNTSGEEEYSGCDMQSVERPSLSGAED